MVGTPRLHGRTPLQNYLCYHVFHNDSSSGNSVFNTTYNFNGGNMCGGGFWGGFKGGLGMGLGAGLMSMLGGFMGGFPSFNMFGSGMFGGFPSFNMFGGGLFGGFPMMNFWNNSTTTTKTDGAGGNDKKTTTTTTNDENKDYKPIREMRKEYTNLLDLIGSKGKSDAAVLAAAKALYIKVVGYGTPNDGVADEEDLKNLNDIKSQLEEKFPNIKNNSAIDDVDTDDDNDEDIDIDDENENVDDEDEAEDVQPTNNPAAGASNTPASTVVQTPTPAADDEDSFSIGSGKKKLEDINSASDLSGLTKAQAQSIGKEKAIKILKKLGITQNSQINENAGIKEVLFLLEVSQISVKVAYNAHSSATDHWIAGVISNVEEDENSKMLSYRIDCSNNRGTQGNKYTVEQQNAKTFRFSIKESDDFGQGVHLEDDNVPYVDYKFNGNDPYLYRNGKRYTSTQPKLSK